MGPKLTREEIKERQIEILKFFRETCDRLGLWYSLAYGSLLGAVRHKGYIPWDDDIDVCMPREDYDKLIAALDGDRTARFQIYHIGRDKSYYQNYAKIVDTHTVFIRHDKSIKEIADYGVNMDIFPLDFCPENEEAFSRCRSEQAKWDEFRFLAAKKGWQKRESLLRSLVANAKKAVADLFGCQFFMRKMEKEMRKYNATKTACVCSWPTILAYKEVTPAADLYSDNKLLFEGELYSCFADAHAYLTNRYGDYMQPPPENQRIPPHGYDAYLKDEITES